MIGAIYFLLHYGKTPITATTDIHLSEKADFTIYRTASAEQSIGIIIFPANLTDASQYSDIAQHITLMLQSPVIVLKPKFRLSAFTPALESVKKQFPAVGHWIYIGHSGGGAAACKSGQSSMKPIHLIPVNAYCRGTPSVPFTVFTGSEDHVVNVPEKIPTTIIPEGGHFFITNAELVSPPHQRFVRLLTLKLGDIRDSLPREQP